MVDSTTQFGSSKERSHFARRSRGWIILRRWPQCGIAIAYDSAGRFDDEIAVKKSRLDQLRRSHGPNYPQTIGAMNNLADTYQLCGQLDESAALREELLALRTATLGPDHNDTIVLKNQLAFLRLVQGKVAEAEALRGRICRGCVPFAS